ncbi:MAG TPA: hypothetical protein VNE39_13220 [Planctomycetota bacterium]|nr:hypothetical protein [Planctomycetota bacterium]
MAGPSPPEAVNPDDLMQSVRSRSFVAVLLVSVAVHVVAILGTSIGYMRLMRQYHSWHPRIEMKRTAKERREEEAEAKRKAAHAKFLAEQAKATAHEKGALDKGMPDAKGDAEKGTVPKGLKATSGARPKESSLKLNELDNP